MKFDAKDFIVESEKDCVKCGFCQYPLEIGDRAFILVQKDMKNKILYTASFCSTVCRTDRKADIEDGRFTP